MVSFVIIQTHVLHFHALLFGPSFSCQPICKPSVDILPQEENNELLLLLVFLIINNWKSNICCDLQVTCRKQTMHACDLSNNMIDVTVLSWQLDIHTFLSNNVWAKAARSFPAALERRFDESAVICTHIGNIYHIVRKKAWIAYQNKLADNSGMSTWCSFLRPTRSHSCSRLTRKHGGEQRDLSLSWTTETTVNSITHKHVRLTASAAQSRLQWPCLYSKQWAFSLPATFTASSCTETWKLSSSLTTFAYGVRQLQYILLKLRKWPSWSALTFGLNCPHTLMPHRCVNNDESQQNTDQMSSSLYKPTTCACKCMGTLQ